MFPEKARHWITGPYYSFYYDSWSQWLESVPYTKAQWQPYTFLYWNIKDKADSRKDADTHTLQLIYITPDGQLLIKAVHIIVGAADEPAIRMWLDEQPTL